MQNKNDILIVGAGPVGLYMANECNRFGLTFDLIDKKSELSTHSKALGIHSRTLLAFTQSGLIEPVLQQGLKLTGAQMHANNKVIFKIDLSKIVALYPQIIILPQSKTEKILYDKLLQSDAAIQWQTELTAIQQTTTGTKVTLNRNNQLETVDYKWVIACDGAHSILRHAANFQFTGGQYNNTWWLADLKMRTSIPMDTLNIYLSDTGVCACFPITEELYRLVVIKPDDYTRSISLDAFINEAKKHIKEDFTVIEPVWLNEFHVSHRLIEHYRFNNVFFAGDAAHIHSPMGGQGLNTGLQDIQNLIWKLALVQHGKAKPELLDSYEEERLMVGKIILKETDAMTKMLLIKNGCKKSLRNLFAKCISFIKPLNKVMAMQMAQLTINYHKSSIVQQEGNTGLIKAGKLLPNIYLYDVQQNKKNIFVLLTGIKHHLLVFCPHDKDIAAAINLVKEISAQYMQEIQCHLVLAAPPTLHSVASMWIDPVLAAHKQLKLTDAAAVLIRPDQYIGYSQAGLDSEKLLTYLKQKIFL